MYVCAHQFNVPLLSFFPLECLFPPRHLIMIMSHFNMGAFTIASDKVKSSKLNLLKPLSKKMEILAKKLLI